MTGLDIAKEITWHRRSAQKNSLCGTNRQTLLDLVEKYLSDETDIYLKINIIIVLNTFSHDTFFRYEGDGVIVFTGPEGCGKSALLARLVSHVMNTCIFQFK